MSELPGQWLYRSFFNKPHSLSTAPSFLWATGKVELTVEGELVTGTLGFDHPIVSMVDVAGTVEFDEKGQLIKLVLVGTNAAGFDSQISGWFVPELDRAKEQVLAVVGSVIDKRSGTVGSFLLTEA